MQIDDQIVWLLCNVLHPSDIHKQIVK